VSAIHDGGGLGWIPELVGLNVVEPKREAGLRRVTGLQLAAMRAGRSGELRPRKAGDREAAKARERCAPREGMGRSHVRSLRIGFVHATAWV
jgi:hypothetical protein